MLDPQKCTSMRGFVKDNINLLQSTARTSDKIKRWVYKNVLSETSEVQLGEQPGVAACAGCR